jgi:hypothetical protein
LPLDQADPVLAAHYVPLETVLAEVSSALVRSEFPLPEIVSDWLLQSKQITMLEK